MQQPDGRIDAPCPKVQASGPNRSAARQMLDNVGGSNSEMSAVALYVYNGLILPSDGPLAQLFHRISIVEMRHLQIFGTLAAQLGENPRLWTWRCGRMAWWSPGYNTYTSELRPLLAAAAEGERRAIEKYRRQRDEIHDPNITENLSRILLDEQAHLRAFEYLLQTLD